MYVQAASLSRRPSHTFNIAHYVSYYIYDVIYYISLLIFTKSYLIYIDLTFLKDDDSFALFFFSSTEYI